MIFWSIIKPDNCLISIPRSVQENIPWLQHDTKAYCFNIHKGFIDVEHILTTISARNLVYAKSTVNTTAQTFLEVLIYLKNITLYRMLALYSAYLNLLILIYQF